MRYVFRCHKCQKLWYHDNIKYFYISDIESSLTIPVDEFNFTPTALTWGRACVQCWFKYFPTAKPIFPTKLGP